MRALRPYSHAPAHAGAWQSAATAHPNLPVSVAVNGNAVDATPDANGYIAIRRLWEQGDLVRLELPMTARIWQSHPKVAENRGRIALSRGPVLYCVEHADMPGNKGFRYPMYPW